MAGRERRAEDGRICPRIPDQDYEALILGAWLSIARQKRCVPAKPALLAEPPGEWLSCRIRGRPAEVELLSQFAQLASMAPDNAHLFQAERAQAGRQAALFRLSAAALDEDEIYNLVTQKLGSTIRCESEVGQGTRFVIETPVASGVS